ncbi:TBC1 domain family member 7 isoform X1 [Panulirus ornatus]|uniref:TBC1 domain family member 7 isoform X1 n=1 Tax=Panulirus ornatus TaxID=150431 RepID=UPI003A8A2B55
MSDEKNFRSQFYEKVGLREVEEKRAVEALLKEKPLDEKKFASFCQRSIVPAAYRILVWKLLLHITPRYAESQDYVRHQQTLMYDELWHTLKSLGLVNLVDKGTEYLNDHYHPIMDGVQIANENKAGLETPVPEHYLLMWLISEAKLLHNPRDQLKLTECQQFLAVVKKISSFFDNPVDIFQVCSSIWSLLLKNQQAISDALQEAIGMLRKENDILHHHLLKLGLFSSNLLMNLCLSLYCDIFPETAIEKILDKVIAGAFRVLAFVTVSLLLQLRQPLASVSTVSGVRSVLSQIRKEEAEILVTSALDQWLKVGIVKRVQ